MLMGGFIDRERHRYGYGVHSPFAFRMLHDVIRPGAEYYATPMLREISGQLPAFRKDNRILFHLAARLPFASVHINAGKNTRAMDAVLLAAPSLRPGKGGRKLIYDDSAVDFPVEELFATHGSVALLRGKGLAEKIREKALFGLLFHYRDIALYFARPEMRFVAYEIRL